MSNTSEQTTSMIVHAEKSKTLLGFWIYLMTDCILFASLFAVYAVLHKNTFGGPSGQQLFSLPYALLQTLILLTSSLTSGLSILSIRKNDIKKTIYWTIATFGLGLSFLLLEINEFHKLYIEGNGWQRSGFLSSYFSLVGTHGLHILVGLIWKLILIIFIVK